MRLLPIASTLFVIACCPAKPQPPAATTEPEPAPTVSAAPQAPAPAQATSRVTDTLETSAGPVTITPIHHGTLALGFAGKTIVFDPFSKAPEGWLPKADLVLVTDIHGDHLDPKGIEAVRKVGTTIIAPRVVADELPEAKVLSNGEKTEALGITIEAVPMYNLTRGPEPGKLFHDKGRGNGYLLRVGDKTLYISGDTACTDEMKALQNVDLAFVCMNLPYTMPPEEAAECVKAFKPKVVIPFHYRDSDLSVFEKALADTSEVEVRRRDFYATP